jgi:predicted RNase H-like HicB family nuclease
MRFEGRVYKPTLKKDRFWGVEIPILHIHTQGTSRKDAYAMAADAIESLIYRKGFKVKIYPGEGNTFTIDSTNSAVFLAFMLRRQREFRNLTVREVAARLESKSPNAYAQYESGKISPSIDKLIELLQAIDPEFEPILKAG